MVREVGPDYVGRWTQIGWGGGPRLGGEVDPDWMGRWVQVRWGGGPRLDGEVGSG